MSDCYVLDDCLLHHLAGEAGSEAQGNAMRLLRAMELICDRIAYLEGSSWIRKVYDLMEKSSQGRASLQLVYISKYLQRAFITNSNKIVKVRISEVSEIPDVIVKHTPADDLYLFKTYFTASAIALVTTDMRLINKLSTIDDQSIVTIKLLDEFIQDYLTKSQGRLNLPPL
jgi:hypothetical protein